LEDEYMSELLTLLKIFKGDRILAFSYEQKDDLWSLFIHLSNGVIQVRGNKKRPLGKTLYASPIIETVPWSDRANSFFKKQR